MAELGRNM